MVSEQAGKHKTIKNNSKTEAVKPYNSNKKARIAVLACMFVGMFLVTILILLVAIDWGISECEAEIVGFCPTIGGAMINSDECVYTGKGVKRINFQPVVDRWVASVGGEKGIVIYDLNTHEVAASYNADKKFATASIYKLFVVYEGYRKLQNGEWSVDSPAGNTGRNILQCLDLAIRESHSPCAESLWAMIGRGNLDAAVQNDFGLPGVEVGSLSATPFEIMKIMRKFYYHDEITDENLISVMEDSFLNQPATTYNWRQGLPSGFSNSVKVYNKVGWNYNGSRWTIYDDAAIVKFTNEDRNFIVVVMTSGTTYQQIRNLASELEQEFNQQI